MKTPNSLRNIGLTLCLIHLAHEPAYGTQPPDVVTSDNVGNTAMGSNALPLSQQRWSRKYGSRIRCSLLEYKWWEQHRGGRQRALFQYGRN